MKIEEFKEEAEELLNKIESLINKMPQKGDTSSECQKINLTNNFLELYYAVNGTTQEDLIPNEDEEN